MNKRILIHVLLITTSVMALPVLAQTCKDSITATTPDSRYTDNGDGTLTDSRTGLMWKQCSEGLTTTATACDTGTPQTYTWQQALDQVSTVNGSGGFAGHTDWRLPNRNELASLIERKCFDPAINTTIFPNILSANYSKYWSSTSNNGINQLGAWDISFWDGSVGFYTKTSSDHAIRLVRNTF